MSTQEGINLSFRYMQNDYLSAMGARYGRSARSKIDLAGSIIAILVGIVCFLFLQSSALGAGLVVLGAYLIGVGIGALAFTIQNYGITLRVILGKDTMVGDEYRLTFSDDGISIDTAHSSYKADWSHYHDIAETNRVYLLFYAMNVYTLVPKRVFPSTEVETLFRDLVKRKVSSDFS